MVPSWTRRHRQSGATARSLSEIALQGLRRCRARCLRNVVSVTETNAMRDSSEPMALELLRVIRELQRSAEQLAGVTRSPLTVREVSVLQLVAEGLTNYAIAHRLGITENTVKNHLRNVHQKLDVRCRTQAVTVATRAGWLCAS